MARRIRDRVRARVGRARPRVEVLEGRQLMAAPVVDPVADVSLPAGKTIFVPITGSDADG
jgi:hypothetical protein